MGLNLRSPAGNVTPLPGAIVYDVLRVALSSLNANNFNPAGLAVNSVIELTTTAAIAITGIVAGVNGQTLQLRNVSVNAITFNQEDSNSTPENRFTFSASLAQNQSITVQYVGAPINRWISTSVSAGGGGAGTTEVAGFNIPSADIFGGAVSLNPGGLFDSDLSVLALEANTTTLFNLCATPSSAGTGAIQTPDPTSANILNSIPRLRQTTAATINTNAAIFNSNAAVAIAFRACSGNVRSGGFFAWFRFGWPTARADQRAAVGLFNTVSALGAAVDPSTFLNFVGVCKDEADTNLQLMHNDGAGAATKVNSGISFVSLAGALLDLYIGAPAGGNITVSLFNRKANTVIFNNVEISTNLIAADAILSTHIQANTGATTATAVTVEMNRMVWKRLTG